MKNTHVIGQKAEDLAANFLVGKGLKIIERNFRTRFGEIDIICKDGKTLVFAEIKAKNSLKYGSPYEMVTSRKKEKLINTAKNYLIENKYDPEKIDWRIDVVSIENKNCKIDWFKNAVCET